MLLSELIVPHGASYELAQEIRCKLAPMDRTDGLLFGEALTNAQLEKSEFGRLHKLNNGKISPIKNYRVHQLRDGDFKWL